MVRLRNQSARDRYDRLVSAMNELRAASADRYDIKYDLVLAFDAINNACDRVEKDSEGF